MSVATLRMCGERVQSVASRHLIEIASVMMGARRCARVVVQPSEAETLKTLVSELGLVAGTPSVANVVVRRTGDDEYCARVDRSTLTTESYSLSIMVARTPSAATQAQKIDDLGSSQACGEMLGYPACCVASYASVESGREWVDLASEAADSIPARLPIEANCLAGLFDAATLHPDFFPCTIGCARAEAFVRTLFDAADQIGLDAELDDGRSRMRAKFAILDGAVLRVCSNGSVDRRGIHLQTRLDRRWQAFFSTSDLVVRECAGGLAISTPQGDPLQVRGRLVEFTDERTL